MDEARASAPVVYAARMPWSRSIVVIALLCCAACGGAKQPGSPPAAEPSPPIAPAPAAATPASASGSGEAKAKKCYADPADPDDKYECGGYWTCSSACKDADAACFARCREDMCAEVPCPSGE